MSSSAWKDVVQQKLAAKISSEDARALLKKYAHTFPLHYHEQRSASETAADLLKLESLSETQPLDTEIRIDRADPGFPFRVCLYQYGHAIPLSDSVPLLENMGLRIDRETAYPVTLPNKKTAWISYLDVACKDKLLQSPLKSKIVFRDTLIAIYKQYAENDGLNQLVIAASLSWREVSILRAYTKYLQQIGFRFSQAYIEKTLAAHVDTTQLLVALFMQRLGKSPSPKITKTIEKIEKALTAKLDAVASLDEDRILRQFWHLIKASLRTNYFLTDQDGMPKRWLSIKLSSADVPDLPLPRPLYEIFIYSPRFEGIHLRASKVARGGIRWSDRREDFRTEVLGLMKAQRVKNAVIVPSGAKGGFVLKQLPAEADRATTQQEVIACYQSFIRGLLDITDNLIENKPTHPSGVICHDDMDPYFVVAADKGTATFSDTANAISAEYNFWLGDAFASGGSAGYDHKKIGITARGAWESVKRHLRELEIDMEKTVISVVGIGDMSGDVFGNGMIYTDKIKLLAAFDHRHIFLDPNPDATRALAERKRMFVLPTSSWADYNVALISKGGGVYARNMKSITLTAEVKKILDITDNTLTPNELIRAILKAPVDLIYNGGIGTYVKSSTESNADVGDRNNDFCRINGSELRCKVVGEGGNLGFTQLGRVEYALNGGLINTDFIDNSAGVDCSDHEVNLKILFNQAMATGKLSRKERDRILVKMTETVADHVLSDNYNQALAMSFSAHSASNYLGLYQTHLKNLETVVNLDRVVEYLPDDKKLLERKAAGIGLTRPELAVLLAWTKIHIKQEILTTDLHTDAWFERMLERSFPNDLPNEYRRMLNQHKLRAEIIATQLSNRIVNSMGITFVFRIQNETGMTVPEIIRAHTVAAEVFCADEMLSLIYSLDFKIPMKLQFELLHQIRQLLNLATRWFLRNKRLQSGMTPVIAHYAAAIKQLKHAVPHLVSGASKNWLAATTEQFVAAGLSAELADQIAIARMLYTALNVTEVATHYKFPLERTAAVYFNAGTLLNLVWFRDQIASDSREGQWNNMARLTLRDELDNMQRRLSIVILQASKKSKDADTLVSAWLTKNPDLPRRWERLLELLHDSPHIDYTLFFIALRELSGMIGEYEIAV